MVLRNLERLGCGHAGVFQYALIGPSSHLLCGTHWARQGWLHYASILISRPL